MVLAASIARTSIARKSVRPAVHIAAAAGVIGETERGAVGGQATRATEVAARRVARNATGADRFIAAWIARVPRQAVARIEAVAVPAVTTAIP